MLTKKNEAGKEVLIGSRVTLIAGIFSIFAIICYLLCYYLITERVRPDHNEDEWKKNSIGTMFSNALKNRALISIIAASVVVLLAQLTMQNMSGYVFPEYYNNATAQSLSSIFMLVSMTVSALITNPLAKRTGKAELSVFSSIFAAVVSVAMYLLRPESVWIYMILQSLCWFGLGMFSMVSWALITDVIDYAEIKNGIREDGVVYALYSFARKLGQAFASGLSGWLLTFIGYNESSANVGISQTEQVLDGIYDISTLVPAAGFILLAVILWFWYPLHKKQVIENVRILKEKRKGM